MANLTPTASSPRRCAIFYKKTKMKNKLIEIENRYLPIINLLEKSSKYKEIYKGFITLQSKINKNPDILFLGINPGEGASKEERSNNLRRTITTTNNKQELDWLKKGVCRGEFVGKTWFAYNWYDKNKKVNNVFPARMIEILISYVKKQNILIELTEKNLINEIENNLQNKIMFTNLYPIATKSTKELNQILIHLSKETDISEILSNDTPNKLTALKNFFRQRTIDFIKEINPKVIVFLGHTSYNSLTLKKNYKEKKIFIDEIHLRKSDTEKYKIISFSRVGNWSPLINDITDKLIEK